MTGPHQTGEVDVYLASAILAAAGYPTKVGTIRVWASRGKVRKVGRDGHGRTLYRFADIWALAARRAAA